MEKENNLITKKHILIFHDFDNVIFNENLEQKYFNEIDNLKKNFCGNVITNSNKLDHIEHDANIYICGNVLNCINELKKFLLTNQMENKIYVVKELSFNYYLETDINIKLNIIEVGQVPINVFDSGVFFRKAFNYDGDIYQSIVNEHEFQNLTESNKITNAFRKGIYISNVIQNENNDLEFHLLRCSTNLSGPTDNFRKIDNMIMEKANELKENFFDSKTSMNHVLAQIYHNSTQTIDINQNNKKEKKAKIKTHSDKTKDMPMNGLMGFCSFYQNYKDDDFTDRELKKIKKSQNDIFDYVYGNSNTSVLTKLRFRLKSDVENNSCNLAKQFDVILYPNSLFVISLRTNRLYTHEIIPSSLPVDIIPTRMGYVIRCSKTKAIYKNKKTFLINNDMSETELSNPDEENIQRLKDLYFKENISSKKIIYEGFNFSLNTGDYSKPII